MAPKTFNVRVRVAPPPPDQRLTWVVNVKVEATSANHAKGMAAYQTQLRNGGCRVEALDVWAVDGAEWTKVSA